MDPQPDQPFRLVLERNDGDASAYHFERGSRIIVSVRRWDETVSFYDVRHVAGNTPAAPALAAEVARLKAEKAELVDACVAVESWWLSSRMEPFANVPGCIYGVSAMRAKHKEPTE